MSGPHDERPDDDELEPDREGDEPQDDDVFADLERELGGAEHELEAEVRREQEQQFKAALSRLDMVSRAAAIGTLDAGIVARNDNHVLVRRAREPNRGSLPAEAHELLARSELDADQLHMAIQATLRDPGDPDKLHELLDRIAPIVWSNTVLKITLGVNPRWHSRPRSGGSS